MVPAPRRSGDCVCLKAADCRAEAPGSAVCEPAGLLPRAEAASKIFVRGAAQRCEILRCTNLPTDLQHGVFDGLAIPQMPCMFTIICERQPLRWLRSCYTMRPLKMTTARFHQHALCELSQ